MLNMLTKNHLLVAFATLLPGLLEAKTQVPGYIGGNNWYAFECFPDGPDQGELNMLMQYKSEATTEIEGQVVLMNDVFDISQDSCDPLQIVPANSLPPTRKKFAIIAPYLNRETGKEFFWCRIPTLIHQITK